MDVFPKKLHLTGSLSHGRLLKKESEKHMHFVISFQKRQMKIFPKNLHVTCKTPENFNNNFGNKSGIFLDLK